MQITDSEYRLLDELRTGIFNDTSGDEYTFAIQSLTIATIASAFLTCISELETGVREIPDNTLLAGLIRAALDHCNSLGA